MSASTVEIDPGNAAQLAAWDGDEGAYWAQHADRFDRSIAAHHARFLAAADVRPADRVLDVGCGTGQTTRDVARSAHAGSALGVDLSSRMLEHARRQAASERVHNVEFLQADAQVHRFEPETFDAAIARTSAMFFADHTVAFTNVRRALRRGARLTMLTWQPLAANEWLREIATALAGGREPRLPPPGMGPFSLSEPDRVRALLTAAGFRDVVLDGVEAPMWFGDDAADASAFILGLSGWMLDGLDDAGRQSAIDTLHATAAAHTTADDGVTFGSATWIVTAAAG